MKKIVITIEESDDRKDDNVTHPWNDRTQFYPSNQQKIDNGWVNGVDLCAKCPNNPANGGTGICMCAIPHMYGPGRITCCYA